MFKRLSNLIIVACISVAGDALEAGSGGRAKFGESDSNQDDSTTRVGYWRKSLLQDSVDLITKGVSRKAWDAAWKRCWISKQGFSPLAQGDIELAADVAVATQILLR